MSRVANRGPLGQRRGREQRDKARLAAVASLPCCICHEYGLPQTSRTQVHHCIHGRYGTLRAPDSMTIPLCEGHHQGDFDTSKTALHREPKKWREQYGADTEWLSWTEKRLGQDERRSDGVGF